MRTGKMVWVVGGVLFLFMAVALIVVCSCNFNMSCTMDWLSSLSGWAALLAAAPTVFLLAEQIQDADRHQRTGFAIELRRKRLIAETVIRYADEARCLLRDAKGDIRPLSTNMDFFLGALKILEGEVIKAFEQEIAIPIQMSGNTMAQLIKDGIQGDQDKAQNAPALLGNHFQNLRKQAKEFLLEVECIAGKPDRCIGCGGAKH